MGTVAGSADSAGTTGLDTAWGWARDRAAVERMMAAMNRIGV